MKLLVTVLAVLMAVATVYAHPWLLAVIVPVLLLVATRGRGHASTAGMLGHAHGGDHAFIARHEAGHAAVARKLGFRGVTVKVWKGGGHTRATHWPDDPVAHVAVARAGQYAVGSRWGCGGDDDIVRDVLRGVPAADRGRVRRQGEALGRRTARKVAGDIRRDAARIERDGQL